MEYKETECTLVQDIIPTEKNASLVVERGNVGLVLGSFRNEKAVEEFEKALKEMLGGGE